MITVPPARLDPNLVAFVGRVQQQLTPRQIPGVARPAAGITVVATTVLSGVEREATVEVFPLTVDPGCTPIPRDPADLPQQYPVGALVAVIGRPFPYDAHAPTNQTAVVTWPSDYGGVGRVPDHVDRTSSGCLDFRAFQTTYETVYSQAWSPEIAWRDAQRAWFEDFEFLSCLAAIGRMADPTQREDAIRSMGFSSGYHAVDPTVARKLYSKLVKRASLPRSSRVRLKEEFEENHDAR